MTQIVIYHEKKPHLSQRIHYLKTQGHLSKATEANGCLLINLAVLLTYKINILETHCPGSHFLSIHCPPIYLHFHDSLGIPRFCVVLEAPVVYLKVFYIATNKYPTWTVLVLMLRSDMVFGNSLNFRNSFTLKHETRTLQFHRPFHMYSYVFQLDI